MPDLSIGARLALGFGAVLAILLVVIGVYVDGDRQQTDATRLLMEQVMPRADAANDVETAYLRESSAARSYVYSGDERYLADYQSAITLASQAVSRLDNLPKTPEGNAIFAEVQTLASNYSQAAGRAVSLRQQGRTPEAQQVVEQEMMPTRNRLLERTDAFVSLQVDYRDRAGDALSRLQEESRRTVVVLALLALLCSIGIAYWAAQSVRSPAKGLVAASRNLAAGKYELAAEASAAVAGPADEERTRDEIRRLALAFGSAARGLAARERRLSAQAALSAALASTIGVEQLAQESLREIAGHVGAELGAIYLHDAERGLLVPARTLSLGEGLLAPLRQGEGIPGEAAASGRTVLLRDIPEETPFRVKLGFDQLPPRWIAGTPMVCQQETVGVLLLAGLRELDTDGLAFVESSAQQLGVSLQNGLAHRKVEMLASDLQEKNELLAVQNEELQAQNEEIQAQNEELQAQAEELQAQAEELQAQAEEIQTQNEELQTQNEELGVQTEELAQQNELLADQAERISHLQAVSLRLSQSLHPEDVLDHVVETLTELTGSAVASVLLLDNSASYLSIAASRGLDVAQASTLRLPRENSVAGRVLEEGRPLFFEDVRQAPQARFPVLATGQALGAIIVAPIMAHGESIGVVEVYYTTPRQFSTDEVELLSALASAAAVAIHNSRLFEAATSQKTLLEGVLAEIPEAVFVTDEHGLVLISNRTAGEMLGVVAGQMLAPLPGSFPSEGASRSDLERVIASAISGETVLAQEVSYRSATTAQKGFAQISVVPIVGKDDDIDHLVAVATDISRLKELERAKDEFLSVVSHELKSPLTSVKGYAQLLERRLSATPGDETHTKMTRTITEQADRVVRLVDRLLDLSRAQMDHLELKPEPVDLAELVHVHIQATQVKTDRHRVVASVPTEVIGNWDRGYIDQVVGNLLDNAYRYSPDGGEVRVSLARENGSAVLKVSDEGIGIPEEMQKKVFERHFRTQEAKRVRADGLGIGLYLVRQIVAAHGGRVEVDSEIGKGTTFTVKLPLK